MDSNKDIVVIGSGFASLSAACYLSQQGYNVTLLEKNERFGGRAQQLKKDGFTFDMGPTFYWMPDIFDSFFADFDKKTSDYYHLEKLNPAYKVYFQDGSSLNIADNIPDILDTFEKVEDGSAEKLSRLIEKWKNNYEIAIKDLVYRPGENLFEIVNLQTILKLKEFATTIAGQAQRHFKSEKLRKVIEFPSLFLGAKPSNTPAFYSFMNYADFGLGTWHPKGGMYSVVEAMVSLAKDLGVKLIPNSTVSQINIVRKKVRSVSTREGATYPCDILLSGADYHHTESLLDEKQRNYSENYWDKKVLAPSALLFYVAIDKKLQHIAHHTLFFDADFEAHTKAIYDHPKWPEHPLFYGSFPSISDPSFAPKDKEAATFLIPLAPDIADNETLREMYFEKIIDRLEAKTKQNIRDAILFKQSFCINDFKAAYNSYKGNAYGLANTLKQTHILRPKLRSKKVQNLYFTGQLTVPGPGVPPSIISGKVVSRLIKKYHRL